VRDLIRRLGIRISPGQWQALLNGRRVSFADRSETEATEIVLRADELQQASELQEETSASSACEGCEGLCFAITAMHCLCVGLGGISYCRRFWKP
jgi:hypothetical protein